MANNRLYIGCPEAEKYLMISKGFGSGWNGIRNLKLLEEFLQIDELVPESNQGKTKLILFTEWDDIYQTAIKDWLLLEKKDFQNG